MLRRCRILRTLTLRDLSERLDSFEKEVIDLKSFRKAVEERAPDMAAAASHCLAQRQHIAVAVDAEVLANPLTADEFVELTRFYALQRPKDVVFDSLLHHVSRDSLPRLAPTLYRDFLVRIALRVQELREAPYGLSQMPSMLELQRWYQWSFHDLRSVQPPRDHSGLVAFDHCVRRIFLRHYNVSALLCKGMLELAEREQWGEMDASTRHAYGDLEHFVNAFCVGRAKLRILVSHYVALSSRLVDVDWGAVDTYDTLGMTRPCYFGHDSRDFVGMLCTRCSLPTLVRWTIDDVTRNCASVAVELVVVGDDDVVFVGVPRVICDVVAALLLDAVSAVRSSKRASDSDQAHNTVRVTLVQRRGCARYAVCISDTAGGVPLSETVQLLTCWTVYTSRAKWCGNLDMVRTWTRSPLRLPYAHSSARVVGGEVRITAIEEYGTDRYLHSPATGVASLAL